MQCTADKYNTVDANFAKIAATRSTIIFASGDSGSGYAPPQPNCNAATKGVQYKGELLTLRFSFVCFSPLSVKIAVVDGWQ